MDLQQQQLQQLSDWLTHTEERIMKMETDAPAKNLEIYTEQIEQHRVNTAEVDIKLLIFFFYCANSIISISQFRSFKAISRQSR